MATQAPPTFADELDRADEEMRAELGMAGPAPDPANRPELDAYLDRMLERLAEIRAAQAENDEVARRRRDMIDRWLAQENRTLDNQAAWLEERIERQALAYDYGEKKSRTLPHGKFGTRKSAATVAITDAEKALAFAKAHGLEVKVKESVGKTPLKEYWLPRVLEAGELPDPDETGVEFVPESETFFVTPAGG